MTRLLHVYSARHFFPDIPPDIAKDGTKPARLAWLAAAVGFGLRENDCRCLRSNVARP